MTIQNSITGYTSLICIIADPIKHSKSPQMHNAAFAALGLDYIYLAFEVDKKHFAAAIQGLKAMDIRGCNISMPYKSEIMKYLDHISLVSSLCGSVNTVINDHGILTGTSTDGIGFVNALKEHNILIPGKKLVVLGAGGAARAIIAQSAIDGAGEIVVFKRKNASFMNAYEQMKEISRKTGVKITLKDINDHDAIHNELQDAEILVNATNVGMSPHNDECLIDTKDMHAGLAVFDCIYNPMETELLKRAKAANAIPIGGIGMLLYQGAESFHLWTGEDMPIDVVKKALGY